MPVRTQQILLIPKLLLAPLRATFSSSLGVGASGHAQVYAGRRRLTATDLAGTTTKNAVAMHSKEHCHCTKDYGELCSVDPVEQPGQAGTLGVTLETVAALLGKAAITAVP